MTRAPGAASHFEPLCAPDEAQLSSWRADSMAMDAKERAEQFRQQAIQVLLTEQETIGKQLLQLGYNPEDSPVGARRGRRSRVAIEPEVTVTDALLIEKAGE